MERRFVVGTVAYHPCGNLIARLALAVSSGFELYVFDNSPEDAMVRNFCKKTPGCRYFTCGKNAGLGVGIATLCAQAYYDTHSALLFFDQDTMFETTTLDFVETFMDARKELQHSHSAVVFNAKGIQDPTTDPRFETREIRLGISSGSLFFLENLKRINWHNLGYFIDCVDYEFCFNSNMHGFKICECSTTPGFNHLSEQPDEAHMVFGKRVFLRKYPCIRIADTLSASLKLAFTAARARNGTYFLAVIRSLALYAYWQIIARIIHLLKPQKLVTK